MRVSALATAVMLSCAGVVFAGFNVNVTKAPGFDPASLKKVVVVIAPLQPPVVQR